MCRGSVVMVERCRRGLRRQQVFFGDEADEEPGGFEPALVRGDLLQVVEGRGSVERPLGFHNDPAQFIATMAQALAFLARALCLVAPLARGVGERSKAVDDVAMLRRLVAKLGL